jgi:hypothetical protein
VAEGLTIFGHLGPVEVERVLVRIRDRELSGTPGIICHSCERILMADGDKAKRVVVAVLEELDLMPEGEITFLPLAA